MKNIDLNKYFRVNCTKYRLDWSTYKELKSEPRHVDCLQKGKGWVVFLVLILVPVRKVGQSVESQNYRWKYDECNGDDGHNLYLRGGKH